MECLLLVSKTLISLIGHVGLDKLKQWLLTNVSQRDTLYDLLLSQVDHILNQVQLLINEKYHTALIFLKLGLVSGQMSHFDQSLANAISAYNVATTIKGKYQSMMIAVISLVFRYEDHQKQTQVLCQQFMGDPLVQNLFTCIAKKRYEPKRDELVLYGWCFVLNLLVGIPYLIVSHIPVTVTSIPYIKVNWDANSQIYQGNIGIKGCAERAYHTDQILVVTDMPHVLEDLTYIISFGHMMHQLLKVDEIRINDAFAWVADCAPKLWQEQTCDQVGVYIINNLSLTL